LEGGNTTVAIEWKANDPVNALLLENNSDESNSDDDTEENSE